jgi:hypothetical protein
MFKYNMASLLSDSYVQTAIITAAVWYGVSTYKPSPLFDSDGTPIHKVVSAESVAALAGVAYLRFKTGTLPGLAPAFTPSINRFGALSLDDIMPPASFDA